MLNILYVFGGEKASGAEKVVDRLINYNATNVNAHLFIAPGAYAQGLENSASKYCKINLINQLKKLNRSEKNAIQFYLSAIKNYLFVSWKAGRYVIKNNIQTVHANTVVPASYLLPVIFYFKVFKPKIKFIWSDHDIQYFSGIDHKLADLCVKFYNLTLAVSEAVKARYEQSLRSKISVLYNGLDTAEYHQQSHLRNDFREKFNIVQNKIVVGIAATIEPRKGQQSLINAFEKLNRKHPNISLLLAGAPSSDYPDYVNEVMERISNNENISYLGKLFNMLPFYNGCDIIVNNSSANGSEPLGTTIYEAMAMEKIVLVSCTGGSPEIVTDNHDGFIFIADSEDSLYEKLNHVVQNFSSLYDIGKQARIKVEGQFNVVMMMKEYNCLINSLIGIK